jgi:uncharacterized membrane protein
MTFMNPWLLLAGLGVALPILAHLLNRYQVKRTDWAAMQFLNRTVRVRSRQIRLRDILLLLLRCLAVLLLALAFAKPAMKEAEGVASRCGERRAGIIIALDVSYSMQHSDGAATRFERAIGKIETIAENIHPGDPVSLILLGDEHKVVVRNMAFDPERFEAVLLAQHATPETLDLDSVPRRLKELVGDMEAPQKEIYIVTDMQEQDWKNRSAWLCDAFEDLGRSARTCIVPVQGGPDNLAITSLDLVSGVLRKGTIARYRATVRNCGAGPVANVRVKGLVNNINVDTKTIPAIEARSSETVSLFVPFQNPGPVRITAGLDPDALPVDNSRGAVATIRDRISVLCVEGSSGSADKSGRLIDAALRARGDGAGEEECTVQSVPWVALPAQDLNSFDVVILADVPDITSDQARRFEEYVRAGNGLIWFPGDNMKAAVWNQRSALEGTPLLPAVIEQTVKTSDAMGVGGALDPIMPDHPVCRPLLSLPEDLLSEARFLKLLQVKPSATSFAVLSLAGSASPVLIEHSIGRGHVFMFTTSAGPAWNNMAVTPVFPMVLQQMVTYLTAREFEKPRIIGDSLALSYVDQPDASDAVFDTPSGRTLTVPVREHRNQYVALLEHAREAGFYTARVSVQAPGMPVAVNVDTRESNVECLPASETVSSFEGTGIAVAHSDTDLLSVIEQTRTGRSFWPFFMVAGLMLLLIESVFADRLLKSPSAASGRAPRPAHTEDA